MRKPIAPKAPAKKQKVTAFGVPITEEDEKRDAGLRAAVRKDLASKANKGTLSAPPPAPKKSVPEPFAGKQGLKGRRGLIDRLAGG